MARPKLYRDPIHGQIRYDSIDVSAAMPAAGAGVDRRLAWLVRRLIDCPEFQRLRHIRQNGLANLVFHGAEHSRFAHSMGAAFLAREMCWKIERNSGSSLDEETLLATVAAALLHDIGHGPFSHTLEEILDAGDVRFDHERMTRRIIEEDTHVNQVLREVDSWFPKTVAGYIDKEQQKTDHWSHRIVSSQLDADRLDYLLRDARFTGLRGHGFDLDRLLDFLDQLDGKRIAVDRRALEAVEAYLLTLDHMYRAVYFHHTVRAASRLLESALTRAMELWRQGTVDVFPTESPGSYLFTALATAGSSVELSAYLQLGEFQVWNALCGWQSHKDRVLADLAQRLMRRDLLKTMDAPVRLTDTQAIQQRARELTKKALDFVDDSTVDRYLVIDEPERTSYKQYDWRSEEAADESIWIVDAGKAWPVERYQGSRVVQGLKEIRYFPRFVLLDEVRRQLKQA